MRWPKLSEKATAELKAEYNQCCAKCGCADKDILSVDRANNRLGYELGEAGRNVQILCVVCNCYIKRCLSTPVMPPRQPEWDLEQVYKNRDRYREECKNRSIYDEIV